MSQGNRPSYLYLASLQLLVSRNVLGAGSFPQMVRPALRGVIWKLVFRSRYSGSVLVRVTLACFHLYPAAWITVPILLGVDRLPCARSTLSRSTSVQLVRLNPCSRKHRITQFLARLEIAAGNVVGAGGSVIQAASSLSTEALQPFAYRAFAYQEVTGNGCSLLPAVDDTTNDERAAVWTRASVAMKVRHVHAPQSYSASVRQNIGMSTIGMFSIAPRLSRSLSAVTI